MKELTAKQKIILEFLKEHAKKYGYPPTVREIGERFGILWAAARVHLQAIAKKGFIKLNPLKSRGIEITGLKPKEGIMAPVMGRIRAGTPILAVEDIDSHILIDKSLFKTENAFSLKVIGDSMIEAGIFDGDYVIVKPQRNIENGEIGVVLVGEDATVKRVFLSKDKIRLKSENRNMKPVEYKLDEVSIIGKVIGIVRKI